MFGLRHVRVHVLKVAKARAGSVTGIGVKGIEPFVHFHRNQNALLLGRLGQRLVMLQGLHDGLGHHDVHTPLNALHGNVKVRVVGGKNDRYVPRLERRYSIHIGLGIHLVVTRKCLASQIHVGVDISNTLLHMVANARKLFSLSTHKKERKNLARDYIPRLTHMTRLILCVGGDLR